MDNNITYQESTDALTKAGIHSALRLGELMAMLGANPGSNTELVDALAVATGSAPSDIQRTLRQCFYAAERRRDAYYLEFLAAMAQQTKSVDEALTGKAVKTNDG